MYKHFLKRVRRSELVVIYSVTWRYAWLTESGFRYIIYPEPRGMKKNTLRFFLPCNTIEIIYARCRGVEEKMKKVCRA